MERADKDLAFMLQYENIAWYENGKVRILDRRVYPAKISFVECTHYGEVAQAIKDMVTQSAGPYLAAGMGMALAAYEARSLAKKEMTAFLEKASEVISNARPTTAVRMRAITEKALEVAKDAVEAGRPADQAVFAHTVEEINQKYERLGITARHLTSLFPQKGTVLTQCFGESIVGLMLRESRARNLDLKVVCAETRPYFQGARLTATVALEQGFDVTVITDNMPAAAMKNGMIDLFTSAADAISCDGYVVNKVGTFQLAILCKYFEIPYYTTGAPDKAHARIDQVTIEMRNPDEVLEAMGVRTAMQGVKGYYPAFDVTPPHLISGIVTNKGIYTPYNLMDYFKGGL